MAVTPRISRDKTIMGGEPCVAGTRIPTQVIHEMFYGPCFKLGRGFDYIIEQYPFLTEDDIFAALDYEESFRARFDRRIASVKQTLCQRWGYGCE